MDPYLESSLDYLQSGLWAVYQGDAPILGANVLAFDASISGLLGWCLENSVRVRPSPVALVCLELEDSDKARAWLALADEE